jgi:hypothetical protein
MADCIECGEYIKANMGICANCQTIFLNNKYAQSHEKDSLTFLKNIIRNVILQILIYPHNNFDARSFRTICQLLNAIEKYPNKIIPETRLALQLDHESYLEEMVIRFDADFIWLGLDGIERTAMGSDSYERIYAMIYRKETALINANLLYCSEKWAEKMFEFLECENLTIEIEYYGA